MSALEEKHYMCKLSLTPHAFHVSLALWSSILILEWGFASVQFVQLGQRYPACQSRVALESDSYQWRNWGAKIVSGKARHCSAYLWSRCSGSWGRACPFGVLLGLHTGALTPKQRHKQTEEEILGSCCNPYLGCWTAFCLQTLSYLSHSSDSHCPNPHISLIL